MKERKNFSSSDKARRMNPIDDEFFRKMAEDAGFCEEIITVVLKNSGIKVQRVIPQKEIKNLQGRTVVLDALCILENGDFCQVEVQKANDDDHLRRVRYDIACITANITEPGSLFENVPNVITIFISKSDIFERGLTVYHVDSVIRETGDIIDDGVNRIFVNATVKDGSDVAEMMDIFTVNDKYNFEKFPRISARKYHFKNEMEGKAEMSEIGEEIRAMGREEGRKEGADLLIINQALVKYTKGQDYLEIADDLVQDSEKIKKICDAIDDMKKSGVEPDAEGIYGILRDAIND
ncbi:MAG: PD-(D/E)XK nuclease family transposase [Lachnospiraceae bacterium]|nr:PD-(D/E)XK nuclease family transposase [Lachnospiraceae bacterium]